MNLSTWLVCTNFVLQSDALSICPGRCSEEDAFHWMSFRVPSCAQFHTGSVWPAVVVYSEKEFRAFSDLVSQSGARRMNHSNFGFQIMAAFWFPGLLMADEKESSLNSLYILCGRRLELWRTRWSPGLSSDCNLPLQYTSLGASFIAHSFCPYSLKSKNCMSILWPSLPLLSLCPSQEAAAQ